MAQSIFQLIGSIMVDTDQANESIAKTEEKAGSLGSTLADGAKKVGKFAAGVGAAAVGAAAGLTKLASDSAASMDVIDKGSQKMGISAEAYQEWNHVMSQSGVDISVMQNGMKTLQNQMAGVAEGTETSIALFDQLGVSVYNTDGTMKDQTTMLDEVMNALAGMEDGAERTALAVDLFGRAGTELMPVLNSGADGIQGLKDEAHNLGLVFSDEAVSSGVVLGDTMANIKDAAGALVTGLGTALTPVIQEVCDLILDFMPTLKDIVDQIGPVLLDLAQDMLPVLADIAKQILPPLLELVTALMPLFKLLCDTVLPIVSKFIELIATGISEYLIPAITWVVEKVTAGLPVIQQKIENFKNKVVSIFDAIKEGIKKPVNAVIGFINGMCGGIVDGINVMIRAMNKLSFDVPDWIPGIGGKTFGFNLNELSYKSIPLLAEGAVIEPNKPFAAVLGDQKNGTNIEAPLDTIKQAVAEVIANMTLDLNLNATPDTKKWFRDMQAEAKIYTKTTGKSSFA